MADDVNIGDAWTSSASNIAALGTHPAWVRFTSSGVLGGTVKGPTGLRRLVWVDGDHYRNEGMFRVLPPSGYTDPDDIGTPWMAVISDRDGNTIMADGVRGVACIGTPKVRLTDGGPAKAVLVMEPGPYTWSDGSSANVAEGHELAVWIRDADSRALVPVFRGTIRQVERGLTITVTAYDRVMDLAEYSDQYQPHNTHAPETSWHRSASASSVSFQFQADIGQIISAYAYHRITADPLDEMDMDGPYIDGDTAIIPVPDVYPVAVGSTISHLQTKIYYYNTLPSGGEYVRTTFMLLTRSGSRFTKVAEASADVSATSASGTIRPQVDVSWTVTTSNTYIGVYFEFMNATSLANTSLVLRTSTTRYWVSTATRYRYRGIPGASFTAPQEPGSNQPELLVTYCTGAGSVATSDISASTNTATVPNASLPAIIQDDHDDATVRTDVQGAGLRMDYYAQDSIVVAEIVRALITNAGMVPDLEDEADLGTLSYYTSSTFDYLTCIRELLRGADYGVKDTYTAGDGGTIVVRPRHTLDEDPVAQYTTDPAGAGVRAIVNHDLTKHWMAERATPAIIAESTTTSGIPIALETDDRLFADSLASTMGSPMRGVSADNSAGTHAMLALSAGGAVRELHHNVVEGTVTLAGYRLAVWDLSAGGEGGNPIRITVPEAGVDAVAIPTEIVLEDGVTRVTLDNIRAADRSEVARSMANTADNVSNQARTLPDVVYIFVTHLNYNIQEGTFPEPPNSGGISLNKATGGVAQAYQTSADYIRHVEEDPAGYHHIAVYFPAKTPGIAVNDPTAVVGTGYPLSQAKDIMPIDNPKYVLAGQSVHLDIRIPKHPTP